MKLLRTTSIDAADRVLASASRTGIRDFLKLWVGNLATFVIMPGPLPWKPIAIVTTISTILLSLLLLPACCCVRGPATPASVPVIHIPPIGTEATANFSDAVTKVATQTQMRNVDFHFDPIGYLDIHELRGEMQAKEAGQPLNFDNRMTFVMRVDRARIGMKSQSLDDLMNSYVFKMADQPLRNLHITMDGKQLKQEGIIHKIIDIPFTMWGDLSVSNGMIRIHPTKISICGMNGLGLLKAVGTNLEKMIGKELPHDRGVFADKNDLLMDPNKMLPPPKVELTLVDVHVEGDELMQIYDAGKHQPDLQLPHPEEKNTMYFRGGTLRMGKLLMPDADMQVVDTDPSDPFDFFIDRYNQQLVAGFSRNQDNYALFVFMRDFNDIGTPPKPRERLAPPTSK